MEEKSIWLSKKHCTSGSSIYTSFSTELNRVLKFTKNKKVVKIKISDLKALESQGVIKIYDSKEVKKIFIEQGDKSSAASIYNNMIKNKEVLIEGEIPSSIIKQVPKDQIKGNHC